MHLFRSSSGFVGPVFHPPGGEHRPPGAIQCKYTGLLNRARSPIGWFVVKVAGFTPQTAPYSGSFPCRQQPSRSAGPAFIDSPPTPRNAGESEFIQTVWRCARASPGTQRRPVGVRDLLCRWHTRLIFYDAHVSAARSAALLSALNLSWLTFGVAAPLLLPLPLPLPCYPDREDRKEETMSCPAHIFRAGPILTSVQMCTSVSSFLG